jgi:hypothetical protein
MLVAVNPVVEALTRVAEVAKMVVAVALVLSRLVVLESVE